MNVRKVIRKRLRGRGVAADVHAVVSVSSGGSSRTSVSSRQTVVEGEPRREPRPREGR